MRLPIAGLTQSKGLVASGLVFLAAIIGLAAALIYNQTQTLTPIPVTMDFRILAATVKYGEGLPFSVEYCNRTDETVTIERNVIMTEISRTPHTNVLYYANIPADVKPGCTRELPTVAPLPPEIVPGVWRVQHLVYTVPQDEQQERRKVQVAEPEFKVVAE